MPRSESYNGQGLSVSIDKTPQSFPADLWLVPHPKLPWMAFAPQMQLQTETQPDDAQAKIERCANTPQCL